MAGFWRMYLTWSKISVYLRPPPLPFKRVRDKREGEGGRERERECVKSGYFCSKNVKAHSFLF